VKIVVSRKGVDSGSGGMASPILPCGCLCSIPIPYIPSNTPYTDIWFGKHTIQQICKDLKSTFSQAFAHLDPDLRPEALASRPKAWRPAFGQSGPAARHLINKRVGAGDLFIFFEWFRRTIKVNGTLAFDRTDANGRHIVWVGSKLVRSSTSCHCLTTCCFSKTIRMCAFLKRNPHQTIFT
jgi:hypothetical protein